ncbi:MAG: hypothetical protein FWG99_09355 [Treponema sp.]|nr:hypothetical protein [Treponema sp.]
MENNKVNYRKYFYIATKGLAAIAIALVIITAVAACKDAGGGPDSALQYVELPLWQEFQQRVDDNLPGAYQAVGAMWDSCFPGLPEPLPTLNKSAVYYDAAKVLIELSELWGSKAAPEMNIYAVKCAEIFHAHYTAPGPLNGLAGYVRFPHGLAYLYHDTGQQFYKEALEGCALRSNWASVNPVNERSAYSREVSYAISVYIAAIEAGMDIPNITTLLNHFVDMALSHLDQWHTGDFYNPSDNFRQPFMVGLSMNSLIEYYEKVYKDPRIPAAIKIMLDDLWEQSWDIIDANTPGGNYSVYTLGYGAFWYWADFANGKWVNDINNMPSSLNLNPDTNMNLASVYAWYARWLKENRSSSTRLAKSYLDKSVLIWEGYVINGYMGYADILWQGCRYVSDFVREYRRFYGE